MTTAEASSCWLNYLVGSSDCLPTDWWNSSLVWLLKAVWFWGWCKGHTKQHQTAKWIVYTYIYVSSIIYTKTLISFNSSEIKQDWELESLDFNLIKLLFLSYSLDLCSFTFLSWFYKYRYNFVSQSGAGINMHLVLVLNKYKINYWL